VATYSNGILGSYSGTVGSVVFSTWNGIPVIRSRPVRKNFTVSVLQEQQRAKFKLMSDFIRPLKGLLNQTFKQTAVRMSCINKALSINKSAITGNYPFLSIDYAQILLSKGRLPFGEPPTISSPESGKLLLTWRTGDGIDKDLTSGSSFITAYQEDLNRWIFGQYDISNGITSCMLDVTPFVGKSAHTYIGFISKNGKKTSESRYMGVVNILP
jgi:Family of unknown function (DUF6266)